MKVGNFLADLVSGTFSFIAEIASKRYALYQLVKRDLAERYAGSYFGLAWVVLQQALLLFVMWFVLQFGLRVQPAGSVPFLAWILPAVILWAFFSEALSTASNSLVSYSYIVKKIQFKLSILPLVKVLSAAVIHGLFLLIAAVVLGVSGVYPTLYWFQLLYYFAACVCFVLGTSWLLSAVMVFFRDLSAGIVMILNVLMWLTPIYWNLELLPGKYKFLYYLNPVCYLTEGYRKSLLYQTGIWTEPLWSLYFWIVTALMMIAGIFVFRKLKPHFADVL